MPGAKVVNGHLGVHAWAQVFAVPHGSPELARYVTGIVGLAGQVRSAITERHPQNNAAVSKRTALVEAATLLQFHQEWKTYWREVEGDSTLDVLDLASSLLDSSDPVKLVVTDVQSCASTWRVLSETSLLKIAPCHLTFENISAGNFSRSSITWSEVERPLRTSLSQSSKGQREP